MNYNEIAEKLLERWQNYALDVAINEGLPKDHFLNNEEYLEFWLESALEKELEDIEDKSLYGKHFNEILKAFTDRMEEGGNEIYRLMEYKYE